MSKQSSFNAVSMNEAKALEKLKNIVRYLARLCAEEDTKKSPHQGKDNMDG